MYKERLLEVGIPANIKGFEYLNTALLIYQPCMKMMALYAKLAVEYSTTSSKVERCIRHAISLTNDVIPNGHFIAKYKILWESEKAS